MTGWTGFVNWLVSPTMLSFVRLCAGYGNGVLVGVFGGGRLVGWGRLRLVYVFVTVETFCGARFW